MTSVLHRITLECRDPDNPDDPGDPGDPVRARLANPEDRESCVERGVAAPA